MEENSIGINKSIHNKSKISQDRSDNDKKSKKKFLDPMTQFTPSGRISSVSKQLEETATRIENSIYANTKREPMLQKLRDERIAKLKNKKSPKVVAAQRMKEIIAEMEALDSAVSSDLSIAEDTTSYSNTQVAAGVKPARNQSPPLNIKIESKPDAPKATDSLTPVKHSPRSELQKSSSSKRVQFVELSEMPKLTQSESLSSIYKAPKKADKSRFLAEQYPLRDVPHLTVQTSVEMKAAVADFMARNLGSGYWQDEVASKVAAPLSSEIYSRSRVSPMLHVSGDHHWIVSSQVPPKETKDTPSSLTNETDMYAVRFRFSGDSNKAARRIQRAWRAYKNCLTRAATKLQAIARGRIAHNRRRELRAQLIHAAVVVQSLARMIVAREVARSLLYISNQYRGNIHDFESWEASQLTTHLSTLRCRIRVLDSVGDNTSEVNNAITTIQRKFRGKIIQRDALRELYHYKLKCFIAIELQRYYRGRTCRQSALPKIIAARRGIIQMQACLRGSQARNRYKATQQQRHEMSTRIQHAFRAYQKQQVLEEAKHRNDMATIISKTVRGYQAACMVSEWRKSRIEIEKNRLTREHELEMGLRKSKLEEVKKFLSTSEGKALIKQETGVVKRKRKHQRMMGRDAGLLAAAEEAFDMFDEDGSRDIDIHEFKSVLTELGLGISHKRADAIFQIIDSDHSGTIDKMEFIAWYCKDEPGVLQVALKSLSTSVDPLTRRMSSLNIGTSLRRMSQSLQPLSRRLSRMGSSSNTVDETPRERRPEEWMRRSQKSLSTDDQYSRWRSSTRGSFMMSSPSTDNLLGISRESSIARLSRNGSVSRVSERNFSLSNAPKGSRANLLPSLPSQKTLRQSSSSGLALSESLKHHNTSKKLGGSLTRMGSSQAADESDAASVHSVDTEAEDLNDISIVANSSAALKMKMKSLKFFRDMSGVTEKRLAAKYVGRRMVDEFVQERLAIFRASHPPDSWYRRYHEPINPLLKQ